jgi:hypothetical protein
VVLPALLKEASACFPAALALLRADPASTDALTCLLGLEPAWPEPAMEAGTAPAPAGDEEMAAERLLGEQPTTAAALTRLLTTPRPS